MKTTRILLIALVAVLAGSLSANAKFNFGVKAGVNINKIDISGASNLDESNRCGFTAGVTAEYILPVVGVGFDVSLMYSHMKSHINVDQPAVYDYGTAGIFDGMENGGYNVSGNFFEIPLHLRYQLSLPAMEAIVQPYVFTGPSVAFKLSGEESYANTKSTQWGWDLGLGVELMRHLQIGGGYTFGINKLVNHINPELGAGHTIKARNNYWTITAAYMF